MRITPAREPAVEDRDDRGRRRRLWLRAALPIAGVVAITAGILAGTFYQYQRSRAGVLALSDDLVATLQGRIRGEVASFLRPAADGAATLSAIMPTSDWAGAGRETLEAVGLRLMRRHAQIGLMYVGRGNGDFLMLRKTAEGAIDTKLILHEGGRRRTTWVRRDAAGDVTAIEPAPDDSYDPRTRSWYRGALETGGIYWSDVYVFFTDKAPGVTVAQPVAGSARDAVVGVDLRLDALNGFLAGLESTARGRLAIVNADGRLVAAPDVEAQSQAGEKDLRMPRIHDLGDPVLAEAYDRVRLAGDGSAVVDIDGDRHIVAAASLAKVTDRPWRLLLVAPENAFAGFVATANQRALIILGATVLLAAGMAGTLAYQAVLADRRQRDLERRESRREHQINAMDGVVAAALEGTAAGAESETVRVDSVLMRDLAAVTGADRAGVWRRHGSQLVCATLYDAEARAYTEGSTIEGHECPSLFAALDEEIAANDATQRAETQELATCYLAPAGMRGFYSLPIPGLGPPEAFIWLETARETDLAASAVRRLTRLTAGVLALRWRAASADRAAGTAIEAPVEPARLPDRAGDGGAVPREEGRSAVIPSGDMRSASLAGERSRVLRDMVGADAEAAGGAALYPDATVAVVRLLDDAALARTADGETMPTIARVVDAADRCARELEIPYIKLLGTRVIAVDGFDSTDAEAAVTRMAEFALRLRDPCAEAFRLVNRPPGFSIGLDTGPVMGFAVGFGELYNVWGEAVEVASSLAADATAGRIQVSAACYTHLRARYLLRPLGTYFLASAGEIRTYDLRGQL